MTEGPDVPFEEARPRRTADNNDLFLIDQCRVYARTMIMKLQALDRPDKFTTDLAELMEVVDKGLEADLNLRILKEEKS